MGFPEWTLWGMGLSAAGALLALGLALLGQTPGFLKRTGLSGAHLDTRVRAFTGYAFALLLLAIGFFIAGVPLGPQAEPTPLANISPEPPATLPAQSQLPAGEEESLPPPTSPSSETTAVSRTPATGAFVGRPEGTSSPTSGATPEEVEPSPSPTPPVTAEPTSEATASPTSEPSPTATATSIPTETPTPTLTPTPIEGETAVVDTEGSTIWLRRVPGGQNLVLVKDGDLVILLPGHANQGGLLWREVSTVAGVVGWIREEFLDYET